MARLPMGKWFADGALSVAALTALSAAGLILARAGLGFDLSDQGFYLNTIAYPYDVPVSVTQFGFIYHPLFVLLGEDVSLLRQLNIALTFALALLAAFALLLRLATLEQPGGCALGIRPFAVAVVVAGTALTSLTVGAAQWLPTPSYNSLAFQGFAVAAAGYCLIAHPKNSIDHIGWVLLGFGGFIAAMAKPTSAAALGIVMFVGLAIDGRMRSLGLLIATFVASVCLIATSTAISGSPSIFVQDVLVALENASRLSTSYTAGGLFRWDNFHLVTREWVVLAALVAVATATAVSAVSLSIKLQNVARCIAFVSAVTASALLLGILSLGERKLQPLFVYGYAAIAGFGWLLYAPADWQYKGRERLALIVVFILAPIAWTFGTNGNYWHGASSAAFFFVLGGLAVFARPHHWRLNPSDLAPLPIAALTLSIAFLQQSLARPYRDIGHIDESTVPIRVGEKATIIRVHPELAAYLSGLRDAATKGGFLPGTPVIDLTGHYPGTQFAIGGKPLGASWLIGGYPGSETLAAANLDRVSCDAIAKAWVLRERGGPRSFPDAFLGRYGIDLARDYRVVKTIDSPRTEYPDTFRQDLMSPTRDAEKAKLECHEARRSKPDKANDKPSP